MDVIVNSLALEKAIKKIIESRSIQSTRIDTIAGKEIESEVESDVSPIDASSMMSAQFVDQMPPVDDPAFIPVNIDQLGLSARVISQEVPDNQIEFFYRKLHKLLDITLDRGESSQEEISEAIRKNISIILEQMDDDDPDEDLPEISDEEYDDYLSGMTDPIEGLADELKEHELHITQQWIDGGMLSDVRRNLESQYPEIFDRTINATSKVITLLGDSKMSERVKSVAASMGNREDTVKILVLRKYLERYPEESSTTSTPMSPEQVKMNQELDKEFRDLLRVKTYDEVISLYDERISSSTDPIEKKGYEMLQTVARNKKTDGRKRRRHDHSVRIGEYELESGDPEIEPADEELESEETLGQQTEEDRLNALDAMAPVFGFKNASGIRQWRRKYADPKFKALIGSHQGYDTYMGFHERVQDNLGALLDVYNDIAQKTLENLNSDAKKSNDPEIASIRDSFKYIAKQFENMHEASLESESGLPSTDALKMTAAGLMLTTSFGDLFYDSMIFRPFANLMKKHMVEFLGTKGLSGPAANKFSKMFNGEVDLPPPPGSQDATIKSQGLAKIGIDETIYNEAIKESENFTKVFFTVQSKEIDKKFLDLLNNKKKMVSSFEKSLDTALDAIEFEEEYDIQTADPERSERLVSMQSGQDDPETTEQEKELIQKIASYIEEED